ncbi:MAG TPA: site-specific DNA-methyltransferase [Pirellulales bacterium]
MGDQFEWLCGDSLTVLRSQPTASFDAVVTDPPYCSGGAHIADRQRPAGEKYQQDGGKFYAEFAGEARDQRSWAFWCVLWLSECLRVTKPGGRLLCFIDWRQLPMLTDVVQAAGWTWRSIAAWDKGLGSRAGHKGYHRHQCEYVVIASHGKLPKDVHDGPYPGCFHVPVKHREKFHMTGKPVELMRKLLACVPPGGRVLDPFGGSASTGVAAIELGLHFTGVEATEHYHSIGAQRLLEAKQRA